MQTLAWWFTKPVFVFLDILYPPRCAGCGKVDTAWCPSCNTVLHEQPLLNSAATQPTPLNGLTSTAVHSGLARRAVRALKYDSATDTAQPLAQRMASAVATQHWPIDCVIAVPLHMTRYGERGYNQSQLLATHIAELLGLPDLPGALRRDVYTQSQVGLGRQAREDNVAGVFSADETLVQGQRVLLVDDVFTTGATLRSCATALTTAGAGAIYGVTATRAPNSKESVHTNEGI